MMYCTNEWYYVGGKTDEAIKSYEESVSLQQSAHGSDTECGDIAGRMDTSEINLKIAALKKQR